MTKQEIKDLIAAKIAGQGNQVDIGNALADVLNALADNVDAAKSPIQLVVAVDRQFGGDNEPLESIDEFFNERLTTFQLVFADGTTQDLPKTKESFVENCRKYYPQMVFDLAAGIPGALTYTGAPTSISVSESAFNFYGGSFLADEGGNFILLTLVWDSPTSSLLEYYEV